MLYSDFEKIMNTIREIDGFMDKAKEIGINLIDSTLYDNLSILYNAAFQRDYTKDGVDWIMWYLYEKPLLNGKVEDEVCAWDSDGKPLYLDDDKALWEFLEKETEKLTVNDAEITGNDTED